MVKPELDEMKDHPTFPQESPAMQYVVHQVSMILAIKTLESVKK